jgi:hypothetical protein
MDSGAYHSGRPPKPSGFDLFRAEIPAQKQQACADMSTKKAPRRSVTAPAHNFAPLRDRGFGDEYRSRGSEERGAPMNAERTKRCVKVSVLSRRRATATRSQRGYAENDTFGPLRSRHDTGAKLASIDPKTSGNIGK